jgi:hypothetical protein
LVLYPSIPLFIIPFPQKRKEGKGEVRMKQREGREGRREGEKE